MTFSTPIISGPTILERTSEANFYDVRINCAPNATPTGKSRAILPCPDRSALPHMSSHDGRMARNPAIRAPTWPVAPAARSLKSTGSLNDDRAASMNTTAGSRAGPDADAPAQPWPLPCNGPGPRMAGVGCGPTLPAAAAGPLRLNFAPNSSLGQSWPSLARDIGQTRPGVDQVWHRAGSVLAPCFVLHGCALSKHYVCIILGSALELLRAAAVRGLHWHNNGTTQVLH